MTHPTHHNVLPTEDSPVKIFNSLALLNQALGKKPWNVITIQWLQLGSKLRGGYREKDYSIRLLSYDTQGSPIIQVVYEKDAYLNRILRK